MEDYRFRLSAYSLHCFVSIWSKLKADILVMYCFASARFPGSSQEYCCFFHRMRQCFANLKSI
uniref:Uncharacterized protein n=1 Tax=Octopus bimaculoides TaxID=37653 RepID=A0A0L8HY20_OCTBM